MKVAAALLALILSSTAIGAEPVQNGGARHIVCYSGGVLILEDDSDPIEPTYHTRTMTFFLSAASHRHIGAAADCIVSYAGK